MNVGGRYRGGEGGSERWGLKVVRNLEELFWLAFHFRFSGEGWAEYRDTCELWLAKAPGSKKVAQWFPQWWKCCLGSSTLRLSSKDSKMIHWVPTACVSTCTLTTSVHWPEQMILNSIQAMLWLPLWVHVCSLLCLSSFLIDFHDLLTLFSLSTNIKWE